MEKKDRLEKYHSLRKEFHKFSYENFSYNIDNQSLSVKYHFTIDDKFSFEPTFSFLNRNFYHFDEISQPALKTLLFNIGMVELVSYWKTACPKEVVIKPFKLDDDQIRWWKRLYFNGLGEFFYLNGIEESLGTFMDLHSDCSTTFERFSVITKEETIVPIGGGKDSVVTLEALRDKMTIRPMIINPRGATTGCALGAGFNDNDTIIVQRTLDTTMLQMNKDGYLNGHTPFSAMLAFQTLLAAVATHSHYIALSNESSANEPTVPDTEINHQYSKSIEFEKDFRDYVAKYITQDIEYFSFLRPLSEMQIAMLFSRAKAYHPIFRSCNAGSKENKWCCNCPKCLFTWFILSPFLTTAELTEIFGSDLSTQLIDPSSHLSALRQQLDGSVPVKPFECVGTVDEVQTAINSAEKKIIYPNAKNLSSFLKNFDQNNYLPKHFAEILKENLGI